MGSDRACFLFLFGLLGQAGRERRGKIPREGATPVKETPCAGDGWVS